MAGNYQTWAFNFYESKKLNHLNVLKVIARKEGLPECDFRWLLPNILIYDPTGEFALLKDIPTTKHEREMLEQLEPECAPIPETADAV